MLGPGGGAVVADGRWWCCCFAVGGGGWRGDAAADQGWVVQLFKEFGVTDVAAKAAYAVYREDPKVPRAPRRVVCYRSPWHLAPAAFARS